MVTVKQDIRSSVMVGQQAPSVPGNNLPGLSTATPVTEAGTAENTSAQDSGEEATSAWDSDQGETSAWDSDEEESHDDEEDSSDEEEEDSSDEEEEDSSDEENGDTRYISNVTAAYAIIPQIPNAITYIPGYLPRLGCGTDPLDAIQTLFDRMLNLDRCANNLRDAHWIGPLYRRQQQYPYPEYRTRAGIYEAYMHLFLQATSLDLRIYLYVCEHITQPVGTGLLYRADAEMVWEENRGFKLEMYKLARKIDSLPEGL